jgi:hypothetical protein
VGIVHLPLIECRVIAERPPHTIKIDVRDPEVRDRSIVDAKRIIGLVILTPNNVAYPPVVVVGYFLSTQLDRGRAVARLTEHGIRASIVRAAPAEIGLIELFEFVIRDNGMTFGDARPGRSWRERQVIVDVQRLVIAYPGSGFELRAGIETVKPLCAVSQRGTQV